MNFYTEHDYNQLSSKIISCCIEVHSELGPGLMESVYEYCLLKELENEGLEVYSQVELPIYYKREKLNKNFRIDILVERKILLELKSVENVLPVHEAQLVSYLKLSNIKLGLLVNFNERYLKDGIRRKINGKLWNI